MVESMMETQVRKSSPYSKDFTPLAQSNEDCMHFLIVMKRIG
jgi:hypothetical protein